MRFSKRSQIVLFAFVIRVAACANILGVFPIEAPSHQMVFDTYMDELHQRGHNVTVYTHFADSRDGDESSGRRRPKRIKIVDDNATESFDPDSLTVDRMYSPSALLSYRLMFYTVNNGAGMEYTGSRTLLELYAQPRDAYDLIVTETCNTDLYLALVERFSAPFVAWTTSPMFVWSADRMAAPSHPAYIPVLMTSHGTRMDFAQRLHNTVMRSVAFYKYAADSSAPSQKVALQRYRSSSPLDSLVYRTSFLFVHTHHAVWGGRPLPQNVIEVGGLHVKSPKPLSQVRI